MDHPDCTGRLRETESQGAVKRGLAKDFGTYVQFMNEDSVSSESEWRKLHCSSGYVLVGKVTNPFVDLGVQFFNVCLGGR